MNIDPNSALSRVPPEIFSEIFSLASDGESLRYNQGLWSIGRVCGRWRSIVLSDPTLWAVDEEPIPYNVLPYDGGFPWNASVFPSSMGEAPEHHIQEIVALTDEALASLPVIRDYTCITPRTVALLSKHLSRSQAAPLTIDLTTPSNRTLSTDVYLMRFFRLIFSQSCRFKSVSIDALFALIEPYRQRLGTIKHLKTLISSSFAFEEVSLSNLVSCHLVLASTSTPPPIGQPIKGRLSNLRELVLESQNPIHAHDLQVPINIIRLPVSLASLTVRNLSLTREVVQCLPEMEEIHLIKESKAYMKYLAEDIIAALVDTIEHRLDSGMLRSVSITGFTVPKIDEAIWCRIEAMNKKDGVDINFTRLWR